MDTKRFFIHGNVIERTSLKGVEGLHVEAWDKDLIVDDLVGSAKTDQQGCFEIQFDESYFRELFFDRRPDLYFRVIHEGTMLHSTENHVLWNLDSGDTTVSLEIDSGIMSLNKDALRRCDAGIRHLLTMSDKAIFDAVDKDQTRLETVSQEWRSTKKEMGTEEASSVSEESALIKADWEEVSFFPHPIFSVTIIDILRRLIKVHAIVNFAGNADDLRDMGITVRSVIHNIFTITASKNQLATLASQSATRKISTPRHFIPQRAFALAAAEIDIVQDRFDNKGAGSAIGIVDGPVNVMHEAFRNGDGSTRFKYIWLQDPLDEATGPSPADYFAPRFPDGSNPFDTWTDGILYNEDAINVALSLGSSLDDVYGTGINQIAVKNIKCSGIYDPATFIHGSHVAAIAAGSNIGARRGGAAPEADIISVVPKGCWYACFEPEWERGGPDAYKEDAFLDAIQCILELGLHIGQPTVVNCSMGHNLGAHNGNSLFDIALDELLYSWSGRSMVFAAGNNNYDGFRKDRLDHGASTSWTLYNSEERTDYSDVFLDIWNGGAALSIKADVGTQSTGWLTTDPAGPSEFDGTLVDGADRYEVVQITRDAEEMAELHNIRLYIQGFKEASPWTIHLRNDHATADVDIRGWVGMLGRYATLDPHTPDEMSINDSACARSIISVGATNKRLSGAPEEIYINTAPDGTVYRPSGCGPTQDGRIKPDIVAVGKDVFSARGDTSDQYISMTGTSHATPVVAGAVALLLSEQPDLNQDTVKALLTRNADQTGLRLDPSSTDFDQVERNRFGNGRLRMLPVFDHIRPPGVIDVFVRTAADDYGDEPYIGGCFCHAPEVQVQTAELYDNDDPHTTQLVWGKKHAIRVRVHNLGGTPAMATEVRLYYTRPWAAPDAWVECKNLAVEELTLSLDIPLLGFQDFIFDASDPENDRCWVPLEDEVPAVEGDWDDHFCLLVEVYHTASGDEPRYEDASGATITPDTALDVWTRNIKGTNNVALRNLHIR